MKNSQKYSLLFLTGAIAGAAATYYLTKTEKGKEIAKDITDGATKIKETTQAKANEIAETAAEKIEYAKDVIAESASKSLDKAENQITEFQKGIKKAREILETGMSAN